MKATGRVALAKYAARGKQYLVMLRPMEDGLVMQQLLYADEVRPFSEVPMEDADVGARAELKLATQLIEQRAADEFQPETYEDDVKKRIQEQFEAKIETGEEIPIAPAEPPKAQVIDLMEALKASLAEAGPAPPKARGAGPLRKPPQAARSGRVQAVAVRSRGASPPSGRAPTGEARPRRPVRLS